MSDTCSLFCPFGDPQPSCLLPSQKHAVIDFLFIGASNLVVANITTWTDAETPVAETTLTNEKLTQALAKLKGESNLLSLLKM